MPDKILHKRSLTPGSIPTTSSLEVGELAINVADGKLYVRRSGSIGNDVLPLVTANTVTTGSIQATSFSGSFSGSGANLFNIPASGIIGLNLSQIASGSATASISPSTGFQINTNTTVTGSLVTTGALTASSALISGNITVLGTASINTLVVNQTKYSSGSNQLGDGIEDTQTLFGTVVIPTGSLTVTGSSFMTGSLTVTGGITGSLFGTSSFANTASYVNPLTQSVSIRGTGTTSATTTLLVENANASSSLVILDNGNVGIGTTTPSASLHVYNAFDTGTPRTAIFEHRFGTNLLSQVARYGIIIKSIDTNNTSLGISNQTYNTMLQGFDYSTTSVRGISLNPYGGSVVVGRNLIATANDVARFVIRGSGSLNTTTTLRVENANASASLLILDDGTTTIIGNTTITGSLTVVTGSSIELQVTNTGVKIGNATTDIHPVTGSLFISASFSTSSAALSAYKSGSTVLDIQGSQGQLFSVVDSLTGSLMSVNDVSGLPILEVFSDDRIVMGTYGNPAMIVTGSVVNVTGSLVTQGQTIDPALIWFMS